MTRMASRITIGLVRLYQRTVSRLLPPVCRYRPSCSTYAIEAVQTYGLLRGLGLGLWRIMRCHPFTVGGDDPVRSPHTHAVSPISNEPANIELSDK